MSMVQGLMREETPVPKSKCPLHPPPSWSSHAQCMVRSSATSGTSIFIIGKCMSPPVAVGSAKENFQARSFSKTTPRRYTL